LVSFWAFTGKADWQLFVQDLGLMPFGCVIALVVGTCGIVFGIYRFVAYGLLIAICFILGHNFGTEIAAIFIFPGALFFIIGVVMLIVFLRKYPKRPRTEFEPYNYHQ
jgi:Na+/phosphate symporter